MEDMMEKYGDEEQATLAVLEKKERQLESLMFLSSPIIQKLIRKNTRGPMDSFLTRK
jgi:hypothetical protein